MKYLGVIPARYGSTRLEGKPLMDINGHSMIEWVYTRAKHSKLDKLVVATDDQKIYDEVVNFGGDVVMTSVNHNTGTDRIAEVAEKYSDYDVIINIQGDEPLIEVGIINSLIEAFEKEPELKMGTLKHKIEDLDELNNPNAVKVVTDLNDYAIYFSRSVIPYPRYENMENYFRHIGVYGYKTDFVIEYAKMTQTPLEKSESLEQLRVLENGYKIKVIETKEKILGVDTPKDLEFVRNFVIAHKIDLK